MLLVFDKKVDEISGKIIDEIYLLPILKESLFK